MDQARVELPIGEDDAALGWYVELMDANELELAHDALTVVGRRRNAPEVFWRHLDDAAREMGLSPRSAE